MCGQLRSGYPLLLLVTVAALLGTGSQTMAVVVNFPDANLEAAVREMMSMLKIPVSAEITDADMQKMGPLDASLRNITDLRGLQYASNLTYLHLRNNQISDISVVAELTNLAELYLNSNKISDISAVGGLTNLAILDSNHNEISDISVLTGLKNLSWLDLSGNQINDISAVAGLTYLTRLDLEKNHISDISALAGLTRLKYMNLSNNQICDITAVTRIPLLMTLDLSNNQICDITAVARIPLLMTLDLSNNQISDIPLGDELSMLKKLYLQNNKISDLSAISKLSSLKTLYLDNNKISDLSAVAGLTRLTSLYLRDNQISDISAVAGLKNLQYLFLDGNRIETMNLNGADLSLLKDFSIEDSPLTNVLLTDATLSQMAFNAIMDGRGELNTGIAELSGVLNLDMSGVDFADISNLLEIYTMDDLQELLLAGATNLDGGRVVTLTDELDSLNWLDVAGLWDSFDVGAQSALNAWDAVEGNTLVVPEPVVLNVLLVLGGLAMLWKRRRSV